MTELKTEFNPEELGDAKSPRQKKIDERVWYCVENVLDQEALEIARLGASPRLIAYIAAMNLKLPTEQIVHFKLLPVILGYAELGIPKEITEILISKSIESGDIKIAQKAAKIAGRELSIEEISQFDDFLYKAAAAKAGLLEAKKRVSAILEEIEGNLQQIVTGSSD